MGSVNIFTIIMGNLKIPVFSLKVNTSSESFVYFCVLIYLQFKKVNALSLLGFDESVLLLIIHVELHFYS